MDLHMDGIHKFERNVFVVVLFFLIVFFFFFFFFFFFLNVFPEVIELFDTLFLVVRKKHVMTLHWFHHATVLVFVANAHVFGRTNIYVPFTVMNTFVHVLMYLYFALASIRIFVPYIQILTVLQILQMVVGCYVVWNGQYCPEHPVMFYGGLVMYASYFFLFAKFFWDKYSGKAVKMD
jgi:hypothetical protein